MVTPWKHEVEYLATESPDKARSSIDTKSFTYASHVRLREQCRKIVSDADKAGKQKRMNGRETIIYECSSCCWIYGCTEVRIKGLMI